MAYGKNTVYLIHKAGRFVCWQECTMNTFSMEGGGHVLTTHESKGGEWMADGRQQETATHGASCTQMLHKVKVVLLVGLRCIFP